MGRQQGCILRSNLRCEDAHLFSPREFSIVAAYSTTVSTQKRRVQSGYSLRRTIASLLPNTTPTNSTTWARSGEEQHTFHLRGQPDGSGRNRRRRNIVARSIRSELLVLSLPT